MSIKAKAAILLLLAVGLVSGLAFGNRGTFVGDCVKGPDAYLLDIEHMSGADRHELQLRSGDVLRVRFETRKGALHMQIEAPDGTELYAGNGESATEFTVNVPESGTYAVTVEARQAQGTIHIQTKEEGDRDELFSAR